MEESHSHHLTAFGLREQPFAPTADPGYFYATREHKSCLFRLWSSIDERHGIAVVLGNYGTGKTTLLRKLMTGMAADPEKYNTAVIGSPIPSWTSFALLEAIVQQFGLQPAQRSFVSYMESLNRYLLTNRDRVSTLIIDDAQNLNKRGQLELLRLVQNLETPQHKLLNLVLFSQLEWINVLRAAPNFLQRINMTYTLAPLQVDEVRQFIHFRLNHAGTPSGVKIAFDDKAVNLIHGYSEGNPRVIVTLCRNALLLAAQVKRARVTEDIVMHTIEKTTLPDPARLDALRSSPPKAARQESQRPAPTNESEREESPFVTPPQARKGQSNDARANELLLRAARARQQS